MGVNEIVVGPFPLLWAVCLRMKVVILISKLSRCVTVGYQGDSVGGAYGSKGKWIGNIECLLCIRL